MPWVTTRTKFGLYQDAGYSDSYFAQLDMGRLEVYAVSSQPLGTLPAASKVMALPKSDTVFHVEFEDRFVILVTGSASSRNLWVRKLTGPFFKAGGPRSSLSKRILFEGVLIKSPTKPTSDNGLVDAVKSTMGAYHHRLFRLFSDGSLAYHEAQPHACIALNSPSVNIVIEQGPMLHPGMPPFEFTVCGDTGAFPVPPSEPLPPLSSFSRLVWRWSEVVRTQRRETIRHGTAESLADDRDLSDDDAGGGGDASSAARPKKAKEIRGYVTVATPTEELRANWVEQIANYASWHQNEAKTLEMERQVVTKGWGWLKAKGGGLFASWQLCYLVLLSTREFMYYKDENGLELLGSISLVNIDPTRVRVVASAMNAPAAVTVEIQLDENAVMRFCPKAKSAAMTNTHALHWQRVISGAETRFRALHRSTLVEHQVESSYDSLEFFNVRAVDRVVVPVMTRSSWQRLSGNCSVDFLSRSSQKASLLLNGSAQGGDAKTYLVDVDGSTAAAGLRRHESEGPKKAAVAAVRLPVLSEGRRRSILKTTSAG